MRNCDYVVVGGGTAGSVVAARLSEDPDVHVVLLEAGPSDGPPEMSGGSLPDVLRLWGSAVDWAFETTPQPGTDGAVHVWNRGKVLGGSSSINALRHLRGHRSSYDAWEALGATGWNYEALLPFLRRSERTEGRDPRVRGTDGPMIINPGGEIGPVSRAFRDAAREAGHPYSEDPSGDGAEGFAWSELNVVAGRRQSAADAYLRPVLDRPNLTVITGALVHRLLIDGTRCRGAEYSVGPQVHAVHADREVVLCGGTIGSPQILLLSGVGPAADLRALGVPVVADVPGVGANLHDHVSGTVGYASDVDPLTDGPVREAHILARSSAGVDPDLQFGFIPAIAAPRWSGMQPGGFSVFFSLMTPASRGSLRLRNAEPDAAPLIDPAYFADGRDLDRLVTAVRMARAIGETDAFARWRAAEVSPGPDARDDAAIGAHLRRTAGTHFHPVGTCRIGTDDLAVVDPALRVRGVDGLRVADASVMPAIVSANTNATVLAIAERAAAFLAGTEAAVGAGPAEATPTA